MRVIAFDKDESSLYLIDLEHELEGAPRSAVVGQDETVQAGRIYDAEGETVSKEMGLLSLIARGSWLPMDDDPAIVQAVQAKLGS